MPRADLLVKALPDLRNYVRFNSSPQLRQLDSTTDLVQSACRELLGKIDAFEYRGEEAFRGWLFTAVLHKLLTKERDLRAQKRDARREVDLGGHGSTDGLAACYSSVLSPTRQLVAAERVRELEAAFDSLPEHFREVITLSRIAKLSRVQVAEQMGRTEASVRNLLPRALVALAEALPRA
jgi:RNA polymerase sigma factor (sigma-70 family)